MIQVKILKNGSHVLSVVIIVGLCHGNKTFVGPLLTWTAHRQCAREQEAFNDTEGELRLQYCLGREGD